MGMRWITPPHRSVAGRPARRPSQTTAARSRALLFRHDDSNPTSQGARCTNVPVIKARDMFEYGWASIPRPRAACDKAV